MTDVSKGTSPSGIEPYRNPVSEGNSVLRDVTSVHRCDAARGKGRLATALLRV